jgi:Domain of unknown function (DUF4372)
MNTGQTVFAQVMEFIPTYQFQLCVDRYQGNRYVKDFSGVTWISHFRKCGEDSSLGGPLGLRPGGHRQKAILQNSPNSERYDFRKNPDFRGVFQLCRSNRRPESRQATESVRVLTGQY